MLPKCSKYRLEQSAVEVSMGEPAFGSLRILQGGELLVPQALPHHEVVGEPGKRRQHIN